MYTITGQYKIRENFFALNSINNQLNIVSQKVATLEDKLNNSEVNIDERITKIDEKLTELDEINNRVSNNENKINENYNYLKNEVDIVNQKFDQLYDKLNTDVNDLNNKVTNLLSTFNFLHNTQDKYFNYNLQNLSKKIYEISEFIGAPTTKKFTDWFQISNDLVSWINVEYDDANKKITVKFIDTPYDKNSQYKLRFYMKVNHSTLSEVDEEIILNDENERLGTMDEIITAEKEKSEVMKNDELGAKLEEEKKAREIMDSYGIEFFSDSMLDFNQIRKLNKVCDIGKIYNNVKLDKNESKEIIIDLNEYCNVTEFNYLILKRTTLYDLDEYKIKTFYFILDKKTSIYTLFGSLFINRFTKINLRIINPDGSEPIFKIKIDYKLVEDRFSNEILLILLDTKDFEFELEIIDRLNNVNYYNNNLLKDKIFANLSLFKVTVPSIASPAPGVESFDNMNFNSKYIVESLDERFLFDPDFISTGKNLQLLKKFTKTTFDDTLVIPETFRIYISSDEVRYIFIPKIELEHNLFFSQGNFTIEDKNTGYRSLVLTYWDKNTSFNSQNLSFDMEFLYDKDYKKIYIQDVRATDIDDNHNTSDYKINFGQKNYPEIYKNVIGFRLIKATIPNTIHQVTNDNNITFWNNVFRKMKQKYFY